MSDLGAKDMTIDAAKFVSELPEVDVVRLVWIVDLMQTGLFAVKPTRRMSGISPISPRKNDGRVVEMERRLSDLMSLGEPPPGLPNANAAETRPRADSL
jgi:hypothetical protein